MVQIVAPKDVDSKFRFITVAAQRAKQIQNGAKPRVEVRSRKSTRVAMEEVMANAVSWEVREESELLPIEDEVAEDAPVTTEE
jgi:DNA-directed RNA polymerase subunit omega